jgi:cation diffusion facilitator CzcD-associated flavoprotein CzcO
MKIAEGIAKRHMRSQIEDPDLLEQVTPDYTIGCKRILPSNKWYPALSEPNVELVTNGLAEVREHSIVDTDGVEREVDALIFGTGFEVTEMPVTRLVRGRDGRLLSEHWQESARAHLGTAAPGFPNFFILLGPNTGLGHNSMVYMIESQISYVLDALKTMEKRGVGRLEVRREVVDRFADELAEKHEGAVWNTGCASWYLDDTGRNTTLWPDWTWRFRQRTARFDAESYDMSDTPARQSAAVAAAA